MRCAWHWLFAGLVLATACSRREPTPSPCVEASAGQPVDTVLMSFLSRARSAHHVADAKEGSKDLAGAIAALEQLLSGPAPSSPQGKPPEVREVLADTRARLADLRSQ